MMLTVYIACGKVFNHHFDARDAENNAFNAWLESDEFAMKILGANSSYDDTSAILVLRNYWNKYVNSVDSIDCVKVIDSGGRIDSEDDDDCVLCRILERDECPDIDD